MAVEPIDINSADAAQLEKITGLGPAKAKAIVDYRSKNGPFQGTSKNLLRERIAASLPRSPLAYLLDMSRGFAAGLLALHPLVTVFRGALPWPIHPASTGQSRAAPRGIRGLIPAALRGDFSLTPSPSPSSGEGETCPKKPSFDKRRAPAILSAHRVHGPAGGAGTAVMMSLDAP
ncbi:MAG: helix-hairpin-helix domain-containing protein [Halothiobacillaceae bacterium]